MKGRAQSSSSLRAALLHPSAAACGMRPDADADDSPPVSPAAGVSRSAAASASARNPPSAVTAGASHSERACASTPVVIGKPSAPAVIQVAAQAGAGPGPLPSLAGRRLLASELAPSQRLARLLLSRGKLAEALELADQLLLSLPTSADVLCLRGKCLAGQGDFVRAFASYSSALSSDPQHVETLVACAALYKSRNLLQEAVTLLTTAYAVQPADPDICHALAVVLTDLGTQLKQASKLSEGMTKYQEAVAICPTYAPAYYNIGVVHSESQQFEDALTYYQKAVDLNSHYAEPYCNIGVILKNQGRRDDAIAAYERALAAAPNFQIVQNNLAIALTELGTQVKAEGRLEEGIKLYERALSYNPKYPDAIYNLGVAFGEMGKLNRAIFMYEMCINFNPSCAEAFNNLGVILRECGNIERACDYYMAALQIRPNFPQGLNNLAVVYTAQGRSREALQMLQAAILASPDYAEAYNNLGVLQRDVGAVPEAIASYERCLRLLPGSRNAGQNRLLALNYIYPGEEHRVCAEHEEWGRQFQEQWVPLPRRRPTAADSDEQRQLVVGYISPDYFTHSVSYFAEVPLAHNSKGRFCTIAYSCVPKADEKTAHLQAAVEAAGGQWREVARLSEAALAQLIRDDKVDILVELTGHTAGNRLGTMALRPCPVQITWIGYPNTTGLKTVDYRFTDVVCDPLDTCQTFTEELIRLPGCFLCYTPPPDAPPVAPLPALVHGFVTFGSFNNLAKITPGVIGVWARVLEAVPSARLLLKNKPFACQSARGHVLELLERGGVQAQRVDLLPLAPANADHLATYAHMDISLDPFPYAGTTTTCESLYMGVPCISLRGRCHAHNVGVSLLTCLGLAEDWVARTEEEYVRLAVRAASDVHELAALRVGLRQRMLQSPLCDSQRFGQQLEQTYQELWKRWLKQAA